MTSRCRRPTCVPPLIEGIICPSTSARALSYGIQRQVSDAPIGVMTSPRRTSGSGRFQTRSSESASRLIRTSLYW